MFPYERVDQAMLGYCPKCKTLQVITAATLRKGGVLRYRTLPHESRTHTGCGGIVEEILITNPDTGALELRMHACNRCCANDQDTPDFLERITETEKCPGGVI